ncbi:MAG: trypsin-like peptidase domain-containing protein, partial [Nanoarchaeota archaeon]
NIYDSSLRLERSSILEEKCRDSIKLDHFGSGVLLRDAQTGDEYILTANHMTSYSPGERYTCKEEHEGTKSEREIKVLESSVTVQELPTFVVKRDDQIDQALLKIEGKVNHAAPYRGKIAGQLHPGDYVIGVGFPNGNHPYSIANITDIKQNMIFLNMVSINGNSGGGVYRFGNQGLELIGTVRGGTAITPLKKTRELITGTPLEDDYLQKPKFSCGLKG